MQHTSVKLKADAKNKRNTDVLVEPKIKKKLSYILRIFSIFITLLVFSKPFEITSVCFFLSNTTEHTYYSISILCYFISHNSTEL